MAFGWTDYVDILYVITLMFVCTHYILSCLITLALVGLVLFLNIIDITLDGPLSSIFIMMSNIVFLLLNLCHALNINVVSDYAHCSCLLLYIHV